MQQTTTLPSGLKLTVRKPVVTHLWVLVETYYKHGEYNLKIFNSDSELADYIKEELAAEDDSDSDSDSEDLPPFESMGLEELIKVGVKLGNERVDNQSGWGIREIRKIYSDKRVEQWSDEWHSEKTVHLSRT